MTRYLLPLSLLIACHRDAEPSGRACPVVEDTDVPVQVEDTAEEEAPAVPTYVGWTDSDTFDCHTIRDQGYLVWAMDTSTIETYSAEMTDGVYDYFVPTEDIHLESDGIYYDGGGAGCLQQITVWLKLRAEVGD